MKNMKKFSAIVLAIVMVLMYAVPMSVLAYEGDTQSDSTWSGTADGTISVSGLTAGDTVKFYKILAYDDTANTKVEELTASSDVTEGAGGWKVIDPFATGTNAITGTDLKAILTTGITDVLAGKIAKNATGNAKYNATVANGATVATAGTQAAPVEPGLYVAIITPINASEMFNPVFVASDYYTTASGDQSSNWTVDTDLSYSNTALAKKSEITVKKEAAEASEAANETNGAKAVGVGDKVNYTVKTTIPEFADNYTAPLFVINDSLSNGLKLDKNSIRVYNATIGNDDTWTKGSEITKKSGDTTQFTLDTPSDISYKITFDPAYLLTLEANTPIIVEYSAEVTETAITNVNEENNTITIEYSHNPDVDQEGEGKKLRDKTHHYSFTIDGSIWGSSEYRTIESVKVGLDKEGNEITQTQTIANGKTIGALAGAEFKLYTDENCTTEYNKGAYKDATRTAAGNKIVSDTKGYLNINGGTGISGLDAGTYWLKEEKAPDGYIKQQEATKIEIIPTYYDEFTFTDTDGLSVTTDDVLKSYIVKINDVQTAEYVVNYSEYKDGKTSADADRVPNTDVAAEVENMKTTHNDIVIGNAGPITSTATGDTLAAQEAGKIKNTQGTELPSTGGIGTTIFYILGAILVLGAGVLLVTRRRMRSSEE